MTDLCTPLKPSSSSQFRGRVLIIMGFLWVEWYLCKSSVISWLKYQKALSVQTTVRKNWGKLQTQSIILSNNASGKKEIYLTSSNWENFLCLLIRGVARCFLFQWCTKPSVAIFAVLRDRFHMFTFPGDVVKHQVNGDSFYFIKQWRKFTRSLFFFHCQFLFS